MIDTQTGKEVLAETGIETEIGTGIETGTGQEEIETGDEVKVEKEEERGGEVGRDQDAELHPQLKDEVDQEREKIAVLVEVQ